MWIAEKLFSWLTRKVNSLCWGNRRAVYNMNLALSNIFLDVLAPVAYGPLWVQLNFDIVESNMCGVKTSIRISSSQRVVCHFVLIFLGLLTCTRPKWSTLNRTILIKMTNISISQSILHLLGSCFIKSSAGYWQSPDRLPCQPVRTSFTRPAHYPDVPIQINALILHSHWGM